MRINRWLIASAAVAVMAAPGLAMAAGAGSGYGPSLMDDGIGIRETINRVFSIVFYAGAGGIGIYLVYNALQLVRHGTEGAASSMGGLIMGVALMLASLYLGVFFGTAGGVGASIADLAATAGAVAP